MVLALGTLRRWTPNLHHAISESEEEEDDKEDKEDMEESDEGNDKSNNISKNMIETTRPSCMKMFITANGIKHHRELDLPPEDEEEPEL